MRVGLQSNCLQWDGILFQPWDIMIQPQNTYRCEVMSWVKEDCLYLADLLKYLSARKKEHLFKFIKAKWWQQGRVESISAMQNRGEKSIFRFCLQKEFTSMFILAVQLWSTLASTTSNLLSGIHFLHSHSFLTRVPLYVQALHSVWKNKCSTVFLQNKTSMSKERQAPDLCLCICYITYFSNWIHLFIFS